MDIKRREFLRLAGWGAAAAGLDPARLFSPSRGSGPKGPDSSPLRQQLADDEFPFPYDSSAFLCAERIFNLRPDPDGASKWRASLNLLLRADATLDVKVSVAESRQGLAATNVVHSYSGVRDSLTVPLAGHDSDRLYYQVQFRKDTGNWSALSPKSFRLPNARLSKGDQVRVLLIADDHTFDDAEPDMPASDRELMISGDYVNDFLKQLRAKPDWTPSSTLLRLRNGFGLARTLHHIMTYEDPDLLINLGDTNGIGASYRFKGMGLPESPSTDADRDLITRKLWLRMRKMFSALTPSLPMLIALGNHDGEESWNSLRTHARRWRKAYFPLPTDQTYAEGGHPDGNYYAFTWGADDDGRGGVEFIILDCTAFCGSVEPRTLGEWTLGREQLDWFGRVLKKREKHWILPCFHHVLGGWPAGPEESRRDVAYGRGPLFLGEDYRDYTDPQNVEQVRISEMASQAGVNAFLYGHDHVFHSRRLTTGWNRKPMHSLCGGSPKSIGEVWWWQGALWRKHYGEGSGNGSSFFGPSGYTRLTIASDKITADYLSPTGPASTSAPQNVLSRVILDNPSPLLKAEPKNLDIAVEEGARGPVRIQIQIKNEGSGGLDFSLSASKPWLSCAPASGRSWGEWVEITASFRPRFMKAGEYAETLTVDAPGAMNTPLTIPLNITVLPQAVRPPRLLQGVWKKTNDGRDFVLLTWKPERDNRDLSRYHVYLADPGGAPRLLGARPVNRCNYIYASGRRRRLTFLVTAVTLRERESEPAVCTVE